MQPIQVEMSPGHVEIALMYVAEMDATIEDLRVMAMHQRSPINSFMFSNKGVLLDANASALQACHAHTPGECNTTLLCRFACNTSIKPLSHETLGNAGVIAHQLCLFEHATHEWACDTGGASSQTINFKTLFDMGLYPGGPTPVPAMVLQFMLQCCACKTVSSSSCCLLSLQNVAYDNI